MAGTNGGQIVAGELMIVACGGIERVTLI